MNRRFSCMVILLVLCLTACAPAVPAEPPEGYNELTFAWPYLDYIGQPRKDVVRELSLDENFIFMEDEYEDSTTADLMSQEPVEVGGGMYDVRLFFDRHDYAANKGDDADALPNDDALFQSYRFSAGFDTREIKDEVAAIYEALCDAYGDAPEMSFTDVETYLSEEIVSGSYKTSWVIDQNPDYPEIPEAYRESDTQNPHRYYVLAVSLYIQIMPDTASIEVSCGVMDLRLTQIASVWINENLPPRNK